MDGRTVGGRYRLLEQRAIGGMASVWRGVDERTGRAVAVKLLHPHLAADRGARRRLRFEAAALAAIDHPNVVGVRNVVSEASGPALIMDWVEGRSLAERIAADGALAEAEAVAIARDIADGLSEVHKRGFVHRDVKPSNILLDTDGRAHLIDLGIAADAEADGLAMTATDGVVGTMRYLAPERLVGDAAVPATDVWGLGAVLYEMLSGEVAFPSATVLERAESGARIPDRPDAVSDATWHVVDRALVANPAQRYPDAEAMAVDLRAIVGTARVAPGDPWAATTVIPVTNRGAVAGAGTPSVADAAASNGVGGRVLPALLGLGALVFVAAVVWSASVDGPLFDRSDTPAAAPIASPAPAAREPVATPVPTAAPEPADDEGNDGGNGNGRGNGNGNGGNGNGGGGNGRGNGNGDD